jgi:hypothetical protein
LRDLGVNLDGAAVIVELLERIEALEARLAHLERGSAGGSKGIVEFIVVGASACGRERRLEAAKAEATAACGLLQPLDSGAVLRLAQPVTSTVREVLAVTTPAARLMHRRRESVDSMALPPHFPAVRARPKVGRAAPARPCHLRAIDAAEPRWWLENRAIRLARAHDV